MAAVGGSTADGACRWCSGPAAVRAAGLAWVGDGGLARVVLACGV